MGLPLTSLAPSGRFAFSSFGAELSIDPVSESDRVECIGSATSPVESSSLSCSE